MSIRIINIWTVRGAISPMGTVLKPAVRAVTEWNNEVRIRPPFTGPSQSRNSVA